MAPMHLEDIEDLESRRGKENISISQRSGRAGFGFHRLI
jgi:hypothetical protein